MLTDIKRVIQSDPKIRIILIAGWVIQVLFSITATGFYHPDQHFQVIEFSSWQTGEPNSASVLWEFDHPVRATVQIYIFSAWHQVITTLGIQDAFLELTLLRILLGVIMFIVFNIIAIHYFKSEKKIILYLVLLLLNFSWWLPYIKTLFSSEMLSSLFFFGTVAWYDMKKDNKPGIVMLFLTGFLLCLSFYFRFQTGFFIAGFGIWMLWKQKNINHYLLIGAGFIAGALLNTGLDYLFYGKLVLSPYEYFYANIIDERAASFGTSSFLRYLGLLIAVAPLPPLSIFLFYYSIKSFLKKYGHAFFLPVMLFIIGHGLVGHKEERFMFPVLCILPVMMGWGLPLMISYYHSCKKGIRYFLNGVAGFSLILNFLLLVLLMLNPYSQTVHYTSLLKRYIKQSGNPVQLYTIHRSPFETESLTPVMYYRRDFKNLEIVRISGTELGKDGTNPSFLTGTFDQVFTYRKKIDSLGYQPILYSSKLLWKINMFLASGKIKPINDIWVLYHKQKTIPE